MKIALIGSHGVGKTTLCFELAAELKRRGADVEMVHEVARSCPLPINQETTTDAQSWILHTQIAAEIHAAANHDVVLCDRSALDNYCYLVQAAGTMAAWERFLDAWIPTYDCLAKVPITDHPTFDGVRAVDPSFQQRIELLLEGMITSRGISPLRLGVDDRDQWCRRIVDTMLPALEPTLPLFSRDGG